MKRKTPLRTLVALVAFTGAGFVSTVQADDKKHGEYGHQTGAKMKKGQLDETQSADAGVILGEINRINLMEIEMGRMAQTRASSKDVRDYGRHLVDDHQKHNEKVTSFATKNNITLASAGSVGSMGTTGSMGTGSTSTAGTTGTPSTGTTGTPSMGTETGSVTGSGSTYGATGTGATGIGSMGAGSTGTSGSVSGTVSGIDWSSRTDLDADSRRILGELQGLSGQAFDRRFLTSAITGHEQALSYVRANRDRVDNGKFKGIVKDFEGAVEKHLKKAKDLQEKLDQGQL